MSRVKTLELGLSRAASRNEGEGKKVTGLEWDAVRSLNCPTAIYEPNSIQIPPTIVQLYQHTALHQWTYDRYRRKIDTARCEI